MEIVKFFVDSVFPFGFAFAAFIVSFLYLLKLLKAEKKKNDEDINHIKHSMDQLNSKMNTVLYETDKVNKTAIENIKKGRGI